MTDEEIENLAKEYQTDIENGLSSKEAEERLAKYGKNKLKEKKKKFFCPIFRTIQRCYDNNFAYCSHYLICCRHC